MGDETRVCVTCGRKFTWSYSEQRSYREKGLEHAPTHCHDCRETRRDHTGYRSVPAQRPIISGTPDERWEEARRRVVGEGLSGQPQQPPPPQRPQRPAPLRPMPRRSNSSGVLWAMLVVGIIVAIVIVLLLQIFQVI